jgi:hypothetical protein
MKFDAEILRELAWGCEFDDYKVLSDEQVDSSRWESHHELVFRHDGKLYMACYSQGLTECQDSRPFQYDREEECPEVEAYEVTVTKYREKKDS